MPGCWTQTGQSNCVVPAGEAPVLDAVPVNAKLCKGEGVKKGTKESGDSETTTTTKSPKKRKTASAKAKPLISTVIQFNTI